jgi:hypothetical protein
MISGKHAILAVVALALVGTAYSWFYYRGLQRRPLEFWTAAKAQVFIQAPRVEALRLEAVSADREGEILSLPGGPRQVVRIVDASAARGLVHVRHALINGATFVDFGVPPIEPARWEYALRFLGPIGAAAPTATRR